MVYFPYTCEYGFCHESDNDQQDVCTKMSMGIVCGHLQLFADDFILIRDTNDNNIRHIIISFLIMNHSLTCSH